MQQQNRRTDYNGQWEHNPQLCGLLERQKELAWKTRADYIKARDNELQRLRIARKGAKPHRERKSLWYEFSGFYNRMQPVFSSIILIGVVYSFMSGLRSERVHTVYLPIVHTSQQLTAPVYYDYTLLLMAVIVNVGVIIYALRHKITSRLRQREMASRQGRDNILAGDTDDV